MSNSQFSALIKTLLSKVDCLLLIHRNNEVKPKHCVHRFTYVDYELGGIKTCVYCGGEA